MSDLDKCAGTNCPMRNACYRFTATSNSPHQWWLTPPFTINNGIFRCSMYWGAQQDGIISELEKIVGKLKPKK